MKINIGISTNSKFLHNTYDMAVGSLINNGFACEEIYIFRGHDKDHDGRELCKNKSNVNIIDLNYSCFEINSMIGILDKQLNNCDYWFLMHDTCCVGPNFKKVIYNFHYNNVNSVRIFKYGTGNIGAYKYTWLDENREQIYWFKKEYNTISQQQMKEAIVSKEDFLTNRDHFYDHSHPTTKNVSFLNSTRLMEYYSNLDFYKYKANYSGITKNKFIINDLL